MRFRRLLSLAFCGAMLGGCAIHPVQQDVTRVPTAQVVHQIRCETRFSILEKAAQLLERQTFSDVEKGPLLQKNAMALAAMLRDAGLGAFDTFKVRAGLSASERQFFDIYIGTAIAHLFTFEIAEQNVIGAQINPVQMLTAGGMTGIQLGASADFTRSNIRTFAIVETFKELLEDADLICDNYHPAPNFSYPISGEIGMFGVVDTFIDLNQAQPLAKLGLDVKAFDGKAPLFGDTLEFTTILSASATPSITLTAVGTRTGLANSSNFAPSLKRTDKHRVIIGLSLPASAAGTSLNLPKAATKKAKESGAAATPKSLSSNNPQFKSHRTLLPPLTPPAAQARVPSTNAKERALDVAREQLLLNFYNRFTR